MKPVRNIISPLFLPYLWRLAVSILLLTACAREPAEIASEITRQVREIDEMEMVLISMGEFIMGSDDSEGNVEELVYDWIDVEYYQHSPYENPQGAASGEERGIRGGAWFDIARYVRTSMRWWLAPINSNAMIVLRCVMDMP